MLYIYKLVNGSVIKETVGARHTRLSRIPDSNLPFHETVRRGYYDLECRHGSRFPSQFSKNTIKKIWEGDSLNG